MKRQTTGPIGENGLMKLTIPEFIKPGWSGPSLPSWMSKKSEETPPQAWGWEWWYCPDNHCKILTNRKPICPVCNVVMMQKVVIEGKNFNLVNDQLIIQPEVNNEVGSDSRLASSSVSR